MQGPVTVRPVASFAEYRDAMRTWRLAWRAAFDHILPAASLPPADVPAGRLDRLEAAYEDVTTHDDVFVAVADAETGANAAGADSPPADANAASPNAETGVVGFAHAVWDAHRTEPFVPGEDAELRALYVRPGDWNDGVGSALLSHVERAVPADSDARRLVLQTFADNEDGRAFYRARGFEAVGEGTYEVDGEPYPTVVFAKSLRLEAEEAE
jgi:GNAT superfamily N-acetyltransferase